MVLPNPYYDISRLQRNSLFAGNSGCWNHSRRGKCLPQKQTAKIKVSCRGRPRWIRSKHVSFPKKKIRGKNPSVDNCCQRGAFNTGDLRMIISFINRKKVCHQSDQRQNLKLIIKGTSENFRR